MEKKKEKSLWDKAKEHTEFGEHYAVYTNDSDEPGLLLLEEFYAHGWELVSVDNGHYSTYTTLFKKIKQ